MTVGSLKRIATNLRRELIETGLAAHVLDSVRKGIPAWLVVSWGDFVEFHYIVMPDDPSMGIRFHEVFDSMTKGDGVADVIYLTNVLRDVV